MTHHGNTFISFGGGAQPDMGDLEFIQDKVIAGDYFQVSGDINVLNDTIEFIPAAGKTAFLIEAKIISTTHPSRPSMGGAGSINVSQNRVQAQLKIDTVVKDTANTGTTQTAYTNPTAASGVGALQESKFNVLGLSLVGDGIKKIEIENTLDDGSAFATMSGYLV